MASRSSGSSANGLCWSTVELEATAQEPRNYEKSASMGWPPPVLACCNGDKKASTSMPQDPPSLPLDLSVPLGERVRRAL
ncbi:hypothetical protein E2562_019839 [Oryza meyeriana var. granulata]|uniref:Uncharacterized protein n=1 Tax=Oryza meyeriana var. granulata TaxID=110450 RepID=A0A6G1CS00_9ORYZ|nr:hypothetical protein E2562_019839 [Oryza meyeriana var. granulata]